MSAPCQKTDCFGNGNRKWKQGKITWNLVGTDRVKIITLQSVIEIGEAALIISMKKNQAMDEGKSANMNSLQT